MTAITFDTHSYTKKLRKTGLSDRQAEAHSEAMVEFMKETFDDKVATKHDIQELKSELKNDMRVLESHLQKTLTLRMGIIVGAGATLTVALISLVLGIAGLL